MLYHHRHSIKHKTERDSGLRSKGVISWRILLKFDSDELWWTLMNSDDWNFQMMIITLTRAEVISRRVLLWISLMTQIPCRPLSASLVNKLSEREFNWLFKTTCGNLYNLENLGGCNQNYFVTWILLLLSLLLFNPGRQERGVRRGLRRRRRWFSQNDLFSFLWSEPETLCGLNLMHSIPNINGAAASCTGKKSWPRKEPFRQMFCLRLKMEVIFAQNKQHRCKFSNQNIFSSKIWNISKLKDI